MSSKEIYCFDLDGTICSIESDYSMAKPIKHRIEYINELFDNGKTILIDTARGSMTGINWYSLTETQLKNWGVKYHLLRVGTKLNADIYIDDKGINDKTFFDD